MTTETLARTDPRRIACPHCAAPVGEWCRFRNAATRDWQTSEGGVHRHRSRAAHKFRVAGAAPAAQLPLFERPTVTPIGNLRDLLAKVDFCGGGK